jgi:hypothetical protein
MGHETVVLWPTDGSILDLELELGKRDFVPDLIFQEEFLGPRVLLKGLETFDCPKIFWSVDTHLNLFWQKQYGRLFDGIMTPHMSFLSEKPGLFPHAARLARFGNEIPWRPFAERDIPVSFVGRINEHRPTRKWLAEFLAENYPAELHTDIAFGEMFNLCQRTRLAPNEAIMAEVNFRLMETASCGCLTLSQEVGPDQDVLFAPGREIETFSHILELKALLDHYLDRPEEAERKARAAWERVQREHLPRHRAEAVLDFATGLSSSAAKSQEALIAFTLSLYRLRRAGRLSSSLETMASKLAELPPTAEVLSALLRLHVEEGDRGKAAGLLGVTLAQGLHAGEMSLNLTGSMAGLRLGNWDAAKEFWYRHQRTPGTAAYTAAPVKPEDPLGLCLLWCTELRRAGISVEPGDTFEPDIHLPATAMDCVLLARSLGLEELEVSRLADAVLAPCKGFEYMRLGYLSDLSLRRREDWRTGLSLGLVNLRTFRLKEGLEEILLARETAVSQERGKSFDRALAGMDSTGYIQTALAGC